MTTHNRYLEFDVKEDRYKYVDRSLLSDLRKSVSVALQLLQKRVTTTSLVSKMISILTPGNIILAIFAYYLLRLIIESVYYRFFHPLSKFPGPFWASISRLWIAYHNLKEDELYLILKLHQEYGMKNLHDTESFPDLSICLQDQLFV